MADNKHQHIEGNDSWEQGDKHFVDKSGLRESSDNVQQDELGDKASEDSRGGNQQEDTTRNVLLGDKEKIGCCNTSGKRSSTEIRDKVSGGCCASGKCSSTTTTTTTTTTEDKVVEKIVDDRCAGGKCLSTPIKVEEKIEGNCLCSSTPATMEEKIEDNCCASGKGKCSSIPIKVEEECENKGCASSGCGSSKPVKVEKKIEDSCCASGTCSSAIVNVEEEIEDDCCSGGKCSSKAPIVAQVKVLDSGCCTGDTCGSSSATGTPAVPILDKKQKEDLCGDSCCKPATPQCGKYSAEPIANVAIEMCCEICFGGICCHSGCCSVVCCVIEMALDGRRRGKKRREVKVLGVNLTIPSFGYKNKPEVSSVAVRREEDKTTCLLEVKGMTCADCSAGLVSHLQKVSGVMAVQIALMTKKCMIVYDRSVVSESELVRQAELIGFPAKVLDASSTQTTLKLELSGKPAQLDTTQLQAIEELAGITSVEVNPHIIHDAHFEITVVFNHTVIGARRVKAEVDKLTGLSSQVVDSTKGNSNQGNAKTWLWRVTVSCALAFPVLLIAFVFPYSPATRRAFFETFIVPRLSVGTFISWILCTPIQFGVAWSLYISAYKALRYTKKANMDTLVMLSTSTAYFYSLISLIVAMATDIEPGDMFFDTSAILLALIMVGRCLESIAKGKASNILATMMNMQVPNALLLTTTEGDVTNIMSEEVVDVQLLEIGDIVKVLPGSSIPTDGEVVFGSTHVDESLVTGESMPVQKQVGDTIYGSTINQHGAIHIRVTKTVGENMLHHISKLVEDAQASKPDIQQLADTIAAYFVPVVLGITGVVFVVWFSLSQSGTVVVESPLSFSLEFAFTVLVISCPCAFGLAVPTAVMVATSVSAKYGVLFKGGRVLETCHKVSAVVFDKTGTLTIGKPVVVGYQIYDASITPEQFFFIAGSAECGSEHVVGKAVSDYAVEKCGAKLQQPDDFAAVPGCGISCTLGELSLHVGKLTWLRQLDISGADVHTEQCEADVLRFEQQGNTTICVAVSGRIIGVIAMCDTPRAEAVYVVDKLSKMNVEVYLVSGDNQHTAASIGSKVGVSEENVRGGALPGDKSEFIKALQKKGKLVLMVGDGINDSPALACADVGVAMGVGGTDIAKSAADVVLVKSDLHDILIALDISRRTLARIKLNFWWATLYNLVTIPIAAGVFYNYTFTIPPAVAGLSEIFSSVPVIIFSLLLKRIRYAPSQSQSTLY